MPRGRIWLFRTFALCIPLLFFLVLELGLRLTSVGYPTSFLVAHPTKPDHLVDNYKFAWRYFPKQLARTPQPIVVAKEKPADSIRILVFGGSAAMGDPEPAFGMPRVLEALLQDRFPQQNIEVLNCAVTAINSHVVRDIARDCRQLNADAWVVYLGNNEVHGPFGAGTVFGSNNQPLWLSRLTLWLQETKTGQAILSLKPTSGEPPKQWGGMEMFLKQTLRHDDQALSRVYNNFKSNLDAIIAACPDETELLVGTVATNTADFSPFVSLHQLDMSDAEEKNWRDLFQQGCNAQTAGEWETALAAFDQAAKIESDYAELEYRQAQCLSSLGKQDQAATLFAAARDHDALRFRADTRINQIIRETLGSSSKATLIDIAQLVAGEVNGVAGNECFHEHVHFNFAGNYKVASMLASQMIKSCTRFPDMGGNTWMTQQECEHALGLSPFHEILTLQDVQGRLNSPPFSAQFEAAARNERISDSIAGLRHSMDAPLKEQTLTQYEQLISAHPEDFHLRNQFAALLNSMGDADGAAEQFRRVAELLPHDAASQFRAGSQYNRMKQRETAAEFLRNAIRLRPDFARAYNSLGICLSHQKKTEESYQHFAHAIALQPSYDEAYLNWGLVLASEGDKEAAINKYQAAFKLNPNNLGANIQLGKHFVAARDFANAQVYYETVARIKSTDATAQLNLGMLYLQLAGQAELAKKQFLRTLELSPGNLIAKKQLETLNSQP